MMSAAYILQIISLAVSGWILKEVIDLKTRVAVLTQWKEDTENQNGKK